MVTPLQGEKYTVSAEDGLSIGDLYDCAVKVAEKRYLCPDADMHMMDDEGFLCPATIKFEGRRQLKESDPAFLLHSAPLPPPPPHEVAIRVSRMQAYTAGKLAGTVK